MSGRSVGSKSEGNSKLDKASVNSGDSTEKNPVLVDTKRIEDYETDSSESLHHVFAEPAVADYYRKVYEESEYECRELFDPELTWTKQEEKKILRKNDWNVTFWCFIMFTALNFDRYNISQALADDMLDDLNLTTNDYNVGRTINLVCFLSAELPSQLVSKKLGADIWIPAQMVIWSLVAVSQAAITNKAGFYITRGLLGAAQGGFICDICLWMSYFYNHEEFGTRLSFFYISNPLTSALSSLLALPLLKISTSALPEGWRWMFLLEGIGTLLVGLYSFFKMPPSVVHTKAWFRKKGWYTEREEKILVNKVLRDDPTKGDMNNRQPVSLRELKKALLDYDMWPIYGIRILGDIGVAPAANYMTLTLRKLGFSTLKTNALNIPRNIITIFTMIGLSYLAEYFDERALALFTLPVWFLSCLFPLRYWPGAQVDAWGTYALLTVVLSAAPTWPISIAWCSVNSNSVRNRAVSAALVNMFSQAGGIIASNIYRQDDAPLYHRGNEQLIGIAFGTAGLCLFARFVYYPYRNKQKERAWNKLTKEEQEQYSDTTTDDGNKRIDFRFKY
ncbi:Putative allantoate permease [Komagataella phaffii]|uniref:Major faciliator superfamily n=1 Tax=Komagataella phaffii (strain GS115 / ATCC 20864) TaxID=644223 RepID=C4R9D3_KOMPG|nr:GQ67_01361T0 [Komagataella phaffii]AOA66560.1 GQ68_01377T0 [Komagataella phaffii GS115]CAY67028.1 Major faciliator superfamily [Komagataella pastoris]